MTDDDYQIVEGSARSDDGTGCGSSVEVRIRKGSDYTFGDAMADLWRNAQGALRSAGYYWTEQSMNAWLEEKAWENRAEKGEGVDE